MQTLSIEKAGLSYIFQCLELYSGECLYLILYGIGIIFIIWRGRKSEKRTFLYPSLVLLLTVFNPLLPVTIDRFFDVNKEYYRTLWIVPVVPLLAYLAVKFVTLPNRSSNYRNAVFLGFCCIFLGAGTFVYADGYIEQENIYKVPNDVIEVSELIHEHAMVKYPKAICDFRLHMELRQYDASILLTADRTQYLAVMQQTYQDDQTLEQNRAVNRILDVILKGEEVPKKEFLGYLDETNTEFVVVEAKNSVVLNYLSRMGLNRVGETEERVLMHYDLKNPIQYELADYSAYW